MRTLSRAYLEKNSAIFEFIEDKISFFPGDNEKQLIIDMVRSQCINHVEAYNIYRQKYGVYWLGTETLTPQVRRNWCRLFMEELGVDEQTLARWMSNHNQGIGNIARIPITHGLLRQFIGANLNDIRETNYFSIQGEIYCSESFYFSHVVDTPNDCRRSLHGFVQVIAKSGVANKGYVLESITVHSEDNDHEQFLADSFLQHPESVSFKGGVLQPLQNTILAEFMENYGKFIKLVAPRDGTFRLQLNDDVVNKKAIPLDLYLKLTAPFWTTKMILCAIITLPLFLVCSPAIAAYHYYQQRALLTKLALHLADPKNRTVYTIDKFQAPAVSEPELNDEGKEDTLLIGSVNYGHPIESLNSSKSSETRKGLSNTLVVCNMSLVQAKHSEERAFSP